MREQVSSYPGESRNLLLRAARASRKNIFMNILIISTNQNALPLPVMPMGACMVAEAAERSGHTVSLVDLMFEKRPLAAIHAAVVSARPDVIGMSVRNIDNNDMLDTAFFLSDLRLIMNAIRRETDAPVVLGAALLRHPPFEPVVAEVANRLVGQNGAAEPSLDLLHL